MQAVRTVHTSQKHFLPSYQNQSFNGAFCGSCAATCAVAILNRIAGWGIVKWRVKVLPEKQREFLLHKLTVVYPTGNFRFFFWEGVGVGSENSLAWSQESSPGRNSQPTEPDAHSNNNTNNTTTATLSFISKCPETPWPFRISYRNCPRFSSMGATCPAHRWTVQRRGSPFCYFFSPRYQCVLYCTVLYCTVLYCTVLYRTGPDRTVPYRTVPYRTVPYCTVLYRTSLAVCTTCYTCIKQQLTSCEWLSVIAIADSCEC